ncbi:hypothetical protein P154DRAFT_449981 [Amniculicola lignicola CBS 123094]|uniref:Chitin-binding type-4 domain-containing protein n=1 Tax=Amniculicola lignicola CBS 123094 TaxID=1392246 RepID=A0A6A5VVV1_9PLEO|nr:hypothetical protein P154DRAFT_449981 [Amniculicola lignicola CBS 123094]
MHISTIIASTLFTATVFGHGNITSPPARQPGPAMAKVCGAAAVSAIMADGTGPLEGIQSNGSPQCNIGLCKGAQFADNKALVQKYAPGQVVQMTAVLPIPHEGPCNISVVNTKTNTIMETMLVFDSYADENLAVLPPNNTNFAVTMPTDLGTACSVAGACVMQWFWFGTAAQQTYENCVDFVM